MRPRRSIILTAASAVLLAACNTATSPSPSAGTTPAPTQSGGSQPSPSAEPSAPASSTPLPVDPAEAVIPNVEANAEIGFWTFYLSPTFDQYIKDTIARFAGTYPGVKVNWEDHQGTFQQDLNNSFAAGNAPDVINLSVGEGWVSDYASRDLLLSLDETVPQSVRDIYFPGLWKEQLVGGRNFQFPWYQGIAVELINKRILVDGAGIAVEDFPKTVEGLPALCQTIHEKTGGVCDIRLTVNDLLSQMVYEGDVSVMNDAGTAFTFDSPEGVAWLQMYVDMVAAGTVDSTALTTNEDRVGLLIFSAGQAAFYQTGPNLIREVKSNNATLYGDLAVAPAPVGRSGVVGKGLMGISVKGNTAYPNAAIALAQFFTNPRSMVEFSKQVAIYPSSPAAYDDPFFASAPSAIEDSARPIARDIISKYADIVPTIPKKPDVNEVVRKAVESALFDNVPAQQALSEAVAKANALIQ